MKKSIFILIIIISISYVSVGQTEKPIGSSLNNMQAEIQDPTLRSFIDKGKGEMIRNGKTSILGMPKRAFGIAKGHLTFYTGSTPSFGTMYGSGSVGTGSTPGAMGTSTIVSGANGKSPYSGPSAWGTQGLQLNARKLNKVQK